MYASDRSYGLDWIGLGLENWTHVQLCVSPRLKKTATCERAREGHRKILAGVARSHVVFLLHSFCVYFNNWLCRFTRNNTDNKTLVLCVTSRTPTPRHRESTTTVFILPDHVQLLINEAKYSEYGYQKSIRSSMLATYFTNKTK